MFDQESWRAAIVERLAAFGRNPNQDVQLTGTSSLLVYLCVRTIEPFIDAFQIEPIAAVLTLADIHRGQGANHLVRRAAALRYQSTRMLERELYALPELRKVLEALMLNFHTLHLARERLSSSRDEWLRLTLMRELSTFDDSEFAELRRTLSDSGWHARYDAIRNLRLRRGSYTSADLVLLQDGLSDSAANVRSAAARMLGSFADTPPPVLIKGLARLAIHDSDQETRYAAARALGALRERIVSPQLLDQLAGHLADQDHFKRSAAAMALGLFGDLAGSPALIQHLVLLLLDTDSYVREAAAHALGQIGAPAAIPDVLNGLTQAMQDSDSNVHDAALDALMRLRELRTTLAQQSVHAAPVAA